MVSANYSVGATLANICESFVRTLCELFANDLITDTNARSLVTSPPMTPRFLNGNPSATHSGKRKRTAMVWGVEPQGYRRTSSTATHHFVSIQAGAVPAGSKASTSTCMRCTYGHIWLYVCMKPPTYLHMYLYIHASIYMCDCRCVYTCVYTYVHAYTCSCILVPTISAYIHMYIYMNTHMYICIRIGA